jgi:ribonuclease P protein component
MTFFYLARPDAERARVGLTVSRALGGSVQRNRIRRRVREAVRGNLAALGRAADVVINPKRSALAAEFPALVADVAKGFAVIARGAK